MKALVTQWDKSYDEAVKYIERVYQEAPEEYEVEFQRLAVFLTDTQLNPWGFMPEGWCGARGSAESFASFLGTLHHAMVDDGDVCFMDNPCKIYFRDRWDIEGSHSDSDKFIANVIQEQKDHEANCAAFDEKMKEAGLKP